MTAFLLASWVPTLATTAALWFVFNYRRHWFVRPSFLLVVFFYLRIQIYSSISASETYLTVAYPWDFVVLTGGFPLIALFAIAITSRFMPTKSVWNQLQQPSERHARLAGGLLMVCSLLGGCAVVYYLLKVPFDSTGLHALFTDPLSAAPAREDSLKLLLDPTLRYLYGWHVNTFAPIVAVVVFLLLLNRHFSVPARWSMFLCLVAVTLSASFSAARAAPAGIVFVCVMAYLLMNQLRLGARQLILFPLVITILPAIVTILREGKNVTLTYVWEYVQIIGLERAFATPVKVAVLHMNYAQAMGFQGTRIIRPLTWITGEHYLPLANDLALMEPGTMTSALANGNFIYTYYVAFGMYSLAISAVGILAFDAFLLFLAKFRSFAVPIVAVFFLKAALSVEGALTTGLLTRGYLILPPILVFAGIWARAVSTKRPRSGPYSAGLGVR